MRNSTKATLRPAKRALHILSNMPRFEGLTTERFAAHLSKIPATRSIRDGLAILHEANRCDVVVINAAAKVLMLLCAQRFLRPHPASKLVSVDLNLSQPSSLGESILAALKRVLLRKVDRFVVLFLDLRGYERYYGIGPDRSSFIPFKVNGWEVLTSLEPLSSDGEYILVAGRTMRDLNTFLAAMRHLPYPAILLHEGADVLRRCGTELSLKNLPPNVKAVQHDGKQETWLQYIRGAKVVALPILSTTISPSGVSTYLDAMALKKCVVITDGPATRGLLHDEAIIVPASDPGALTQAIKELWENDARREAVAAAGRRYAEQLQGEARYLSDILDLCGLLVSRSEQVGFRN